MIRFVDGNRITLLQNGTDYFPALEAAIDRAVREIYLETYIFEHDHTGQRITAALKRAARRGITTHLLLDGYGTKDLSREVIEELRSRSRGEDGQGHELALAIDRQLVRWLIQHIRSFDRELAEYISTRST